MNKRPAHIIRKAVKLMLEENTRKQQPRHEWEWFVKWLNGEDTPVPPAVRALVEEPVDTAN